MAADGLPGRFAGKWVIDASMVLCCAVLVALVVLVASEVFCRSVLGFDLEITEEIAGYLLVAFAFLSLAGCVAHGAYHRVELLTAHLSVKGRHGLNIAFIIISLLFTLIVDDELIGLVISSYDNDVVAPTLLATPLWIPQLVMPLGTILLTFSLLILLVRTLREKPVA